MRWGWLVVVLTLVVGTEVANADAIDDAIEHLQIGELEDARAKLDSVDVQDRDTMVRLYAARARLAHVSRDMDAVRAALRVLDALDPNYQFDQTVPRELTQLLQELDTPRLSVSVETHEVETGLSLQVRVDDPVSASTGTRLFVRVGADVLETDERSFAVPLGPGQRVEVWAELRANNAVLERWGSADAPNPVVRAGSVNEVAEAAQTTQTTDTTGQGQVNDAVTRAPVRDSRTRRRRIIIAGAIAGVVALAAGAAVGGIVFAKNNRNARLGQPMLID